MTSGPTGDGPGATTVDARGLACPLPLTLAKRAMASVEPGATLVVLATDPEAPIDLAAWAGREGHSLAERQREGFVEFELTKSRGGPARAAR